MPATGSKRRMRGHFVYTSWLHTDPTGRPQLIGIGGPSCAGKSEVASRLAAALDAPVVGLDAYYRDLPDLPFDERTQANFDIPDALDEELLSAQLRWLSEGGEIEVPVYDFTRYVRTGETRRVRAGRFAVVEGLFTLYWEALRHLLDVKVFVAAPDGVCLSRRLDRDVRERGRSEESVNRQYNATVRPMAEKYVLPTRRFADLVLDGTGSIEHSVAAVLARVRQAQAAGRLI